MIKKCFMLCFNVFKCFKKITCFLAMAVIIKSLRIRTQKERRKERMCDLSGAVTGSVLLIQRQ